MNVSFKDLNFTIKVKKDGKTVDRTIIHNTSGTIEAGHMVALMGASGAGKSTLLNILSRRALSHDGEVFYGEQKVGAEEARSSACFIQQEDLFFGKLTVYEHLMYQARLRLPKTTTDSERKAVVEATMSKLGLKKCRDSRIGNVQMGDGRGISGGEQKRLNVATELLTSPNIIFADEPTTGLDSFIAQSVVKSFKDLAKNNRTVICTIHQPSSKIFEMFHSLLMLAEGRLIFFGPREAAVDYFAHLGFECPEYTNPADFLIKTAALTDANRETKLPLIDEWAEKWAQDGEEWLKNWEAEIKYLSEEKKKRNSMRALSVALEGKASEEELQKLQSRQSMQFDKDEDAMTDGSGDELVTIAAAVSKGEQISGWTQMKLLLTRCATCNRRDPILVGARAVQTVVMGFLIGAIFFRLGWDIYDARSKLGASFMFILNQGMLGSVSVTQTFPQDKPIVQREYESGILNPMIYFYAKIFADSFVQIVFPFIFHTIVWWMCGMNDDGIRYLIGYGVLLLVSNAAMSIGYLASCISPSTDVALTIAQVIQLPLLQFSGFMVKSEDIPTAFRWLQWLSPYKYGYSAYVTNVFYDVDLEIIPGTTMKGEDFVDTYLGIRTQDFGPFLGVLAFYLIIVRVGASFALAFFMKRRREYK